MVGSCGVGGTREVGVWVSRDFLSSFIIIIIIIINIIIIIIIIIIMFWIVLDVTLPL
jgi:hypothetical protein